MSDFTNVKGARENEKVAEKLAVTNEEDRNWIVTVRFYSFLHYVEERLQANGYDSNTHGDRMDNIRKCPSIDNYAYNLYKTLYDLSRDARYECLRMGESEVKESKKRLKKGKEILGFTHGGDSHKYSTS